MFFWNSLAFLMIQQVRSPRTFTLPVEVALSVCTLSCVQLFVTPWTVACQAPLSMESSRQECWSWLPFPSPEPLPDPRIEPVTLESSALAGRFFITSATWNWVLTWQTQNWGLSMRATNCLSTSIFFLGSQTIVEINKELLSVVLWARIRAR